MNHSYDCYVDLYATRSRRFTQSNTDMLQDDLAIQQHWYINGKHYSRTLEDWLKRMDAHKKELIPLFRVRSSLERRCTAFTLQELLSVLLMLKFKTSSATGLAPLLQETYGQRDTVKWWVRWRVFYLACSELFAFKGGNTWGVGQFCFENKQPAART